MFKQDNTCPALLGAQTIFTHTGLSPTTVDLPRSFWLFEFKQWADPVSLAATYGISFDFFSSGYLDVSVHQVSFYIIRC